MSPRQKARQSDKKYARVARRLSLEHLDARMVLSGGSFLGTAFLGPETTSAVHVSNTYSPSENALGERYLHEAAAYREAAVGPRRFEVFSAIALGPENFHAGNQQFEMTKFAEMKPGGDFSNVYLPLDRYDVRVTDLRPFADNLSSGSVQTCGVVCTIQGGFVELQGSRSELRGVLVSFMPGGQSERYSSRFAFEQANELPKVREDLVTISQAPSPPANISSSPRTGPLSGYGSDGGAVPISNLGTNNQFPAQQTRELNPRGSLGLAISNSAAIASSVNFGAAADNNALAMNLAQASAGLYGRLAEGGLIDIGANLQSGSLALPGLQTRSKPAASMPEEGDGAKEDLDRFWSDLGEDLESLDSAELALDAQVPDEAATDSVSQPSDLLAHQAWAIHDVEGGMVDLSVQQTTPTALPATSDLRATAATARTNTTSSVEIEMDATVAMFQAFEIETAPQTKARHADAPQKATEDESADSSKQAPQVQPVDRASLSPMSVLLAAAATTIRKRTTDQDEQRKSLRLRQLR